MTILQESDVMLMRAVGAPDDNSCVFTQNVELYAIGYVNELSTMHYF